MRHPTTLPAATASRQDERVRSRRIRVLILLNKGSVRGSLGSRKYFRNYLELPADWCVHPNLGIGDGERAERF